MSDKGIVNIHGKEYKTVARRIQDFRDKHPHYGVLTDVLCAAELVQVKATIVDDDGRVIATGLAEEVRGSTNINKTSALENAETSAVGRALAFFGLGGTEIASADEVANAINQQAVKDAEKVFAAHMDCVRSNLETIESIQRNIAEGNLSYAKECWQELTEDEMKLLWRAPTKGGIFTTREREVMKSNEWSEA